MSAAAVDPWIAFVTELGINVQRARHAIGLTQEAAAYAAGISRSHFQMLERGLSSPDKPSNPSLQTLTAVAAALGTTLAELLPDEAPLARFQR